MHRKNGPGWDGAPMYQNTRVIKHVRRCRRNPERISKRTLFSEVISYKMSEGATGWLRSGTVGSIIASIRFSSAARRP